MGIRLVLMTFIGAVLSGGVSATAHERPACDAAVVITRFIDAWNAANAGAIADLFDEAGDLIIPTGQLMAGRVPIRAFYAKTFESGYASSRGEARILQQRQVAPKVCVIDGTWKIEHGPRQSDPSAVEIGIFSAVLLQGPKGWRISALREQTSAQNISGVLSQNDR